MVIIYSNNNSQVVKIKIKYYQVQATKYTMATKADFDDRVPSPPSVMEPVEDLEADGLEDEPMHDQLPSVEEAKANADMEDPKTAKNARKSRCRFCFYTCCCLCSCLVLIVILAITLPQVSTSSSSQQSQGGNGNEMATLAPGVFPPRFSLVRDFLDAFTDPNELDREGSPVRRAAHWIADEDLLHLDVEDDNFLERYALAVLFFSMGGPNWPLNLGFLSAVSFTKYSVYNREGIRDKANYLIMLCEFHLISDSSFFPQSIARHTFVTGFTLDLGVTTNHALSALIATKAKNTSKNSSFVSHYYFSGVVSLMLKAQRLFVYPFSRKMAAWAFPRRA